MDQTLEEVEIGNHKSIPHCLILPHPTQGHLNPILQFSKRLAHKGVKITFAITKRVLNTTTLREQFPSSVSVETISDGYDDEVTGDLRFLVKLGSFERVGRETLAELLEKLGNSNRRVDCVIYDPFLPWGHDVAKEFGLLAAAFFTQASCVNSIYYRLHKGELKLPLSEREYSVPGLEVALGVGDMPSFLQDHNSYGGLFKLLVDQFRNVEKDDFVFVNSVYEFEQEVTNHMAKQFAVKTIGPTIPSVYLDKRLLDDSEYDLSIFKPVNDCMKWLDKRNSKSVVYVSFGSLATHDEEQMEEIAQGLKMTNKYFLWVVRALEESKLAIDFLRETSEKGLVVAWSPQLEVLSHDAVGCFVTHCGWNSTLEGICLGVPMVAVPWWSDQPTNAKLVMDEWEIGIRARMNEKNIIRRDEIVRCVEHVMEEEGERKIRENGEKWKEIARKAVDEGGSSDRNIEEFVSTLRALPFK